MLANLNPIGLLFLGSIIVLISTAVEGISINLRQKNEWYDYRIFVSALVGNIFGFAMILQLVISMLFPSRISEADRLGEGGTADFIPLYLSFENGIPLILLFVLEAFINFIIMKFALKYLFKKDQLEIGEVLLANLFSYTLLLVITIILLF
ncbi:MAG: hypothetical protein MRZ79_01305 [Bacteroidia bacterium]|nr:hypothetical protein [Bacteroidia bacterium]